MWARPWTFASVEGPALAIGLSAHDVPLAATYDELVNAPFLFRLAGLLACAMVLVQALLAAAPIPDVAGVNPAALRTVVGGVVTIFFAVFATVFWFATARGPVERPNRRIAFALSGLVILALLLHTDLLYVVAAALAYLLPPRIALRAFGLQAIAFVILGTLQSSGPGFEPAPAVASLAPLPRVALTLVMAFTFQLFAFAGGLLAASEWRSRRGLLQRTAELQAAQSLLAESSRRAERLEISRELHDTLGHHLTVLSVQLELARKTCEGSARAAVDRAQGVARLLLADVRAVVTSFRMLPPLDLRRALLSLAAGVTRCEVSVICPERLDLPPAQAHALFRSAQEALTNSLRHAAALHIRMEVSTVHHGARLRVEDDGRGAPALTKGNGLTGLAERLVEVGGHLDVHAPKTGGFVLEATVPGRAAEAA